MISEIYPNTLVTGGPISGTDPSALEMVNDMMESVYHFACKNDYVTIKELIIFMKQITNSANKLNFNS